MSSSKRLLLAACVASSFAVAGCANDSDHAAHSDRGNNGTYDNATSAGARNQGGTPAVQPSAPNDNGSDSAQSTPAGDNSDAAKGAGSRIDGRSGTGVGSGESDVSTGTDNAKPGINAGEGPAAPDKTNVPDATDRDGDKAGPGVGSGNADTVTGANNARPADGDTDTKVPQKPAKPIAPADEKDSGAGVGSSDSDTAAGTDSGSGDVEKK